MYLLQIRFTLSDAGLEDAIYNSYAFQCYIGIKFLKEQVPVATTFLQFRHLLEMQDLGEALFDDINAQMDRAGLILPSFTLSHLQRIRWGETRSGDAPDRAGKPVISWDEGACGCRCRYWLCLYACPALIQLCLRAQRDQRRAGFLCHGGLRFICAPADLLQLMEKTHTGSEKCQCRNVITVAECLYGRPCSSWI